MTASGLFLASTVRKKALPLASGLFLLMFAGCRVETPSPTPSPSPSPTVTPSPTPTPTPTAETVSAESTLEEEVSATNAQIMQAASEDALTATDELQTEVASLDSDPEAAAAREKLARVRSAFFQAELAIFYTDPTSAEEIETLSDPRESDDSDLPSVATTEKLLDAYARLPVNPYVLPRTRIGSSDLAAGLVSQSAETKSALTPLAEAWNPEDPESFRNRFFLTSPEDAIARILQGAISLSMNMLFEEATPTVTGTARREIRLSRLKGIQNILEGTYETQQGEVIAGPGLLPLIEQHDPGTAQALRDATLHSLQAAEESPDPAAISASLEDLQQRLKDAANSLGFEVEE